MDKTLVKINVLKLAFSALESNMLVHFVSYFLGLVFV
jgi:hypothetical protein